MNREARGGYSVLVRLAACSLPSTCLLNQQNRFLSENHESKLVRWLSFHRMIFNPTHLTRIGASVSITRGFTLITAKGREKYIWVFHRDCLNSKTEEHLAITTAPPLPKMEGRGRGLCSGAWWWRYLDGARWWPVGERELAVVSISSFISGLRWHLRSVTTLRRWN